MNIEQKIDKLEQELDWLKEQAKNCKPKYWKPKNGEKAWFIHDSHIKSDVTWGTKVDKRFITRGDVFKTREEAEKELELRLTTQRLKEAIWEANGGEFIDYKDNSLDYAIIVYEGSLKPMPWATFKCFQNWMYIKDMETAEKVLEENRRDFEIYYGL